MFEELVSWANPFRGRRRRRCRSRRKDEAEPAFAKIEIVFGKLDENRQEDDDHDDDEDDGGGDYYY